MLAGPQQVFLRQKGFFFFFFFFLIVQIVDDVLFNVYFISAAF
jgi:hypothetical protein